MQDKRKSGGLLFLMAGLASLALAIVSADGASRGQIAVSTLVPWVLAIAAGRLFSSRYGRKNSPPAWLPVLFVATGLETLAEEWIRREFFASGRAFEILMLCGMRNVMLAAAAASLWGKTECFAAMLSLFLMMFAVTTGDDPFLYAVVLGYTVAGVLWLMSWHWSRLAGSLPDEESRTARPRSVWITLPLVLVGLVALIPLSGESAADALTGFMPSSGGQGKFDPYARRGVGDGDMLVAGTKNVQSFAPIDEAPFFDSVKPSLYDVFSETYEEPVSPKNQDRAIALPPEVMQEARMRMAESQQAGRQFSTLRQAPEPRKQGLRDRLSDALFFVAGRVPLHLRMETYDVFDGIEWYPEAAPKDASPVPIRKIDGKPWVELQRSQAMDLSAHPEPHSLKIGRLETNCIPSPPQLTGIHVDKVDRSDLFGWATSDIIKMNRKSLPPLMVIHLQSQILDRDQLERRHFAFGTSRYRVLPKTFAFRQIQKLAEQWTEGLPRGWDQISAIERKLREHYQLDSQARADKNCICPVAEFLFCSKRGPDYQFATAAAVMLRSLGYPARVVSGFYADPGKYDTRSQHTPIHSEDVHFWVEVGLDAQTWITIEPTPGYEILTPPPTWLDHVFTGLAEFGEFLVTNAISLILTVLLLFGGYVWRRRLSDGLETVYCLLPLRRQEPRRKVLQTLRLIDRRRQRVGWSRPPGMTPTRWLRQLQNHDQTFCNPEWFLFIQLAERAAFGSENLPQTDGATEQFGRLCRSVRQALSWRKMKRLYRAMRLQELVS